jgi:hypothetical protein
MSDATLVFLLNNSRELIKFYGLRPGVFSEGNRTVLPLGTADATVRVCMVHGDVACSQDAAHPLHRLLKGETKVRIERDRRRLLVQDKDAVRDELAGRVFKELAVRGQL